MLAVAHYPNPFAAIRAAWLITRARQGSPGLNQTTLAEDVGVTQAALSKYENGQREPSLADLQRIIARTDYRLVLGLRREPRSEDRLQSMELPDPRPFAVSDLHLARRLPTVLTPSTGQLSASEKDGPRLEETLLYLYEIQQLARDARLPEERLQEAYEQFHHERDRDLIHQMLSVGSGAGQAAAMLARAIHHGTSRPVGRPSAKTDQAEPRADRLVWAHIVCCLRAEEAICRERAARQHRALEAARVRRRARIRVEDAHFLALHGGRAGTVAEVDQAKAELEEATERCADLSRNGGVEDVGLSGERYLAAELTRLADRARTLYEELAQEPAFTSWRAHHASADPLYDAWLDGELHGAVAPPLLYPDRHAFYQGHHQHAQPWNERLDHGEDGPVPFGRNERIVYDQLGQEWQITIAGPGALEDPRQSPQPDAVVVATRCPDKSSGPSLTPVYVLADSVNARQAAEVITAVPRPASLARMAASLRAL